MGFISGLGKVVAGTAVGIAAVTVLPLATVGLGAAGAITAAGMTVGTLIGAAAGVVDEINETKKNKKA